MKSKQEEVDEIKKTHLALTEDYIEVKSLYDKEQNLRADIEGRYKSSEREKNDILAKVRLEKELLKTEISDIKEELEMEKGKEKGFRERIEEMEREIKGKSEEFAFEIGKKDEEFNRKMEDMEEKIRGLKEVGVKMEDRIKELEMALENSERVVNERTELYDLCSIEEQGQFIKELENIEREKEDVEVQLENEKLVNSEMNDEVLRLNEKIKLIESLLHEFEEKYNLIDRQNKDYQENIQSLEANLASQIQNFSLEKKLISSKHDQELANLKHNIKELENTIEQKEKM